MAISHTAGAIEIQRPVGHGCDRWPDHVDTVDGFSGSCNLPVVRKPRTNKDARTDELRQRARSPRAWRARPPTACETCFERNSHVRNPRRRVRFSSV